MPPNILFDCLNPLQAVHYPDSLWILLCYRKEAFPYADVVVQTTAVDSVVLTFSTSKCRPASGQANLLIDINQNSYVRYEVAGGEGVDAAEGAR